jgi:hypothetical protein
MTWKAWLSRLRGRNDVSAEPDEVAEFRREVAALASETPRPTIEALLARGERIAGADVELELEQIQGRLDLDTLATRVARDGLPVLVTQHKALGDERCHYSCPATLVEGESDSPGRLLVGERRLLFLGGRGLAAGWGTVRAVAVDGRDLVVQLGSGKRLLRCISVSDALCAAFIASRLIASRPGRPASA